MSPNLSLRISHLRHVKLSTSNKTAICTGCSRHTRCGLHVYTGCGPLVRPHAQPPPPNQNSLTGSGRHLGRPPTPAPAALQHHGPRLGCRRRRRRLDLGDGVEDFLHVPRRFRRIHRLAVHHELAVLPRRHQLQSASQQLLCSAIGARTAGKPANATERHWWVVSALVGARERLIAHRRQNVLAQVLPIKVVDVPAELELRLAQAYSTPRPATSGWTARPDDRAA